MKYIIALDIGTSSMRAILYGNDGKIVKSYKGETPSKKMFVLIALFQLPWSGKVSPDMPYPKTFEVDYVRVYQKE